MGYDYNDPLVLNLIKQTHVPKEIADTKLPQPAFLLVCEKDLQSWPCPTILLLRAFEDETKVRAAAAVAAAAVPLGPAETTRGKDKK